MGGDFYHLKFNMGKRMITIEELKRLLSYDPDTGVFIWKADVSSRVKKGMVAGTSDSFGYGRIVIKGKSYKSHRLAWAYSYNEFPDGAIDHINANASDNRISNLRIATQLENTRNRRIPKNNTSGVKGVYWDLEKRKWRAQFRIDGKNKVVGYFADLNIAKIEIIKARNKYHKEFARHG